MWHARWPARPRVAAAWVRRRAGALRARRARRRGPGVRRAPRTAGHDPLLQDPIGAGRNAGGGCRTRAGDNLCPVRGLPAYLEAAGIHRGAVYRRMRRGDALTTERLSDQSIALIVERRAVDAGVRSEEIATLSGHSLRAGYATAAAARRGAQDRQRHPRQEPPRPAPLHPSSTAGAVERHDGESCYSRKAGWIPDTRWMTLASRKRGL